MPNPRVAQFARVELIGWVLPIDDTSFRIYVAGRVKQTGDIGRMRSKFNGKFWWDMNEEEHRAYPGDYEAQVGQGPITLHSEEHFGQSDRGVVMVRRMLREQLDAHRSRHTIRSASAFERQRAADRVRGRQLHQRTLVAPSPTGCVLGACRMVARGISEETEPPIQCSDAPKPNRQGGTET